MLCTMDTSIFTSINACERIAARTIRNLAISRTHPSVSLLDVLKPSFHRIYAAGKLTRDELAAVTRKVRDKLNQSEAVVKNTLIIGNKLSTRDMNEGQIVCLQGAGEQWLEMWGVGVMMSRKRIVVFSAPAEFKVHRHALTRYMGGELQYPEHLAAKLLDAAQLSIPIMAAILAHRTDDNLAIPVGDGMLFGKIKLFDGYGEFMTVRTGQNGVGMVPRRRSGMLKDSTTEANMMTYVDADRMVESRVELHGLLSEFAAKHHRICAAIFEDCVFETNRPYQKAIIDELQEDARKLVTSPTWSQFAGTANRVTTSA
jgi:hypothetical protein